jgi:hypothetical protein
MRGLTTHQQFASELDAAHARVREAIAGLTEDTASSPGPDGWSIKDHLTHLTVWHEMRFFELSRVARGGGPSIPVATEEEVTVINNAFAAFRRHMPLTQVIADLEFAWSMVEEAVAACPEDQLERGFSGDIGPVGAAHDISHAEMITRLRQKEGT